MSHGILGYRKRLQNPSVGTILVVATCNVSRYNPGMIDCEIGQHDGWGP